MSAGGLLMLLIAAWLVSMTFFGGLAHRLTRTA